MEACRELVENAVVVASYSSLRGATIPPLRVTTSTAVASHLPCLGIVLVASLQTLIVAAAVLGDADGGGQAILLVHLRNLRRTEAPHSRSACPQPTLAACA